MGLFTGLRRALRRGPCDHANIDPHWNRIEDEGQQDRIDHYICRRCGARFPERAGAYLLEGRKH